MKDNLLIGKRLKSAQKHLGITQTALGKILGIKQAEVSNKMNGAEISFAQAKALETEKGIRTEWLLKGEEPMFLDTTKKDNAMIYESYRYTKPAIAERFDKQLAGYEDQQRLTKTDVALIMDVPLSHLSAIRSGTKDISVKVLTAAMKLGMDLNYTLGGYGTPRRTSNEVDQVKLQDQLDDLRNRLDGLTGNIKQTA